MQACRTAYCVTYVLVPLWRVFAPITRLFPRTVILSLQNHPHTKNIQNKIAQNFLPKPIAVFISINPLPSAAQSTDHTPLRFPHRKTKKRADSPGSHPHDKPKNPRGCPGFAVEFRNPGLGLCFDPAILKAIFLYGPSRVVQPFRNRSSAKNSPAKEVRKQKTTSAPRNTFSVRY